MLEIEQRQAKPVQAAQMRVPHSVVGHEPAAIGLNGLRHSREMTQGSSAKVTHRDSDEVVVWSAPRSVAVILGWLAERTEYVSGA